MDHPPLIHNRSKGITDLLRRTLATEPSHLILQLNRPMDNRLLASKGKHHMDNPHPTMDSSRTDNNPTDSNHNNMDSNNHHMANSNHRMASNNHNMDSHHNRTEPNPDTDNNRDNSANMFVPTTPLKLALIRFALDHVHLLSSAKPAIFQFSAVHVRMLTCVSGTRTGSASTRPISSPAAAIWRSPAGSEQPG